MTGDVDPCQEHRELQAANDFLLAYAADARAGAPRSVEDYARQFPGSEEVVTREFARLADAEEDVVGPYRLGRELGRGAYGTVSEAVDTRSGRRVALKVARIRGHADRNALARLRREARAMAQVDDPCICPVYDVGWDDEVGWIAMRLVRGESLAARIHRARVREGACGVAPESVTSARDGAEQDFLVAFFEKAARGLHRVHSAGFVHRDLKPGNVMIGIDGGPVLLDFGLVRELDAESLELTTADDQLGTPAYMAPEVVRRGTGRADACSDVYGLGLSLFESLTLTKPFAAVSRQQLERAILDEGIPMPRALRKDIRRDLAIVVLTACERNPARRYATAADFADDLQRVRERRAIRARPLPLAVRFGRSLRQHAAVASGVVLVVLWLATLAYRERAAGLTIAAERDAASASALRATAHFLASLSAQVGASRPEAATFYAHRSLRMLPSKSARTMLYAAFQKQHLVDARSGPAPKGVPLTSVGSRLAYVADGLDDSVCIVGPNHEAGVRRFGLAAGTVDGLALSGDGRFAAVVTAEQGAQVVEVATGKRVGRVGDAGRVRVVALGPQGKQLCVARTDGVCELRQVDGAALVATSAPVGAVAAMGYDPEGRRIALLEEGGIVRILDSSDGKQLLEALLEPSQVTAAQDAVAELAWLAGGQLVALAPGAGTFLIDPDGRQLFGLDAPGTVASKLEVDPNGRWFAAYTSGSSGGSITMFDAERRQRWVVEEVPSLARFAVSPGGRWLAATRSSAADVDWIEVATGRRGRLVGHRESVFDLAFLPDGRLVTVSVRGERRAWRLDLPPHRDVAQVAPGSAGLALSRDGTLALIRAQGVVQVIRVADGHPVAVIEAPRAARFRFAGSRRLLSILESEIVVHALDQGATVERRLPRVPGTVLLGEDPTGRWVVQVPDEGAVVLHDLEGPADAPALRFGTYQDRFADVRVDARRGLLVTADGARSTARAWRLADGSLVDEAASLGFVLQASLDRSSEQLLASTNVRSVRTLAGGEGQQTASGGVLPIESGRRDHPDRDLQLDVWLDAVYLRRASDGVELAQIEVPQLSDAAFRNSEILCLDARGQLHAFPIGIAEHVEEAGLLTEPWPGSLVDDGVVEPRSTALVEAAIAWIDAGRSVEGALACVPFLSSEQRGVVLDRAVERAPRSYVARANRVLHLRLESIGPARSRAERLELDRAVVAEIEAVRRCEPAFEGAVAEFVQFDRWPIEQEGHPEVLETLRVLRSIRLR